MFSKSKKKKNYNKGSMQVFSADAIVFSNKNLIFFDPENMKKPPSKVTHNWPPTF